MQGLSELNRELLDASALCRQLVPEGSVEAFLADHRHDLFPDAMFEDLFTSKRGRPSIPADTVASVMVLQALEGLSDRDAARALTDRISWKVACGLALDEAGFDYSVLTYCRSRLRNSTRPERIFEAVRSVIDATGVLKGKTRRRRRDPGHRHPIDRGDPTGASDRAGSQWRRSPRSRLRHRGQTVNRLG